MTNPGPTPPVCRRRRDVGPQWWRGHCHNPGPTGARLVTTWKSNRSKANKGMISRVRLLIHARITAKIVSSQDAWVRYVAMALEKKTGSEKDSFFVFHCPFLEFQF